jgi:hypothetical protein
VGWDGIRFTVPADWNVTGVSTDRANGYLKVDSPGTMFFQVKWAAPSAERPRTLMDLVSRLVRGMRKQSDDGATIPDLRPTLDAYLKETEKRARKERRSFDCKVKPQVEEAGGERIALHFSWTGGGIGQGKIWYCSVCRKTVIAQVVGQPRDPVGDVAAGIFSDMRDHAEGGWTVWGIFDLVAGIPEGFALVGHKLLSGYLKLEFRSRKLGRIVVERWGLANVARKKFTLQEWLGQMGEAGRHRAAFGEADANGHTGVTARGQVMGLLNIAAAYRDALPSLRPALRYEACCWECDATNKLYAVQVWSPVGSASLLGDLVARCECH